MPAVLLVLDDPWRGASVRWLGCGLKNNRRAQDQAFKDLISGGVMTSPDDTPPYVAGKMELRPLDKGFRQRYGRLKFLQVYKTDNETGTQGWAPIHLDQPCVFEPDAGGPPVGPGSGE